MTQLQEIIQYIVQVKSVPFKLLWIECFHSRGPKYILMAFFRGTERKEKLRLHSGKLIIRTRNNPVVNTLRGFLQVFWHFNEYILVLLYYKNEQILISMIPYMPSLPGNQAYVFHFFKITINHPKY